MIKKRYVPKKIKDKLAYGLVKFFRFFADLFFRKRYINRAIVIETVAAVPGMVGAGLIHFRCLRKIKDDEGWIRKLLDEAENERMHLMTFIAIIQPNIFERFLVFVAQAIFIFIYFLMYVMSSEMAHRFVGYLEEEAVASYTEFLAEIDAGRIENCPAPDIAKDYWQLDDSSTLRDVVIAVRQDEMGHREANHQLANQLSKGKYDI